MRNKLRKDGFFQKFLIIFGLYPKKAKKTVLSPVLKNNTVVSPAQVTR